jgi:hypothetical protein
MVLMFACVRKISFVPAGMRAAFAITAVLSLGYLPQYMNTEETIFH